MFAAGSVTRIDAMQGLGLLTALLLISALPAGAAEQLPHQYGRVFAP
jgi:hypothetical protein